MNRRHNAPAHISPALTRGDDRPRAACDRAWTPFEVLMHETRGPGFRTAVNEARAICGLAVNEAGELVTTPDTCPLLATCLVGNDEAWARAILGEPTTNKRPTCGTSAGYKAHRDAGEEACADCKKANAARVAKYAKPKATKAQALEQGRAVKRVKAQREKAARTEELRHMDAGGVGISEACRRLNVGREALWKWCAAHDLRDVYRSLAGRERLTENQWTKGAVA